MKRTKLTRSKRAADASIREAHLQKLVSAALYTQALKTQQKN